MAKPCELIGVQVSTNGKGGIYDVSYPNDGKVKEYVFNKESLWTKDSGCGGDFILGTQQCKFTPNPNAEYSPLTVTGYAARNVRCGSKDWGLPFYLGNNNANCPTTRDGKSYPLYLVELYSNACAKGIQNTIDFKQREDFCNSITDLAGNKKRPRACGGTDPDVYIDDPTGVAIKNATEKINKESEKITEEIEKKIAFKRKVILLSTVFFLLIIFIIFM